MSAEIGILLAVVAVIALLAGFIHSAVGFGFGIVAISILPFVIDARSAHIVVSISSVPMLVMATWTYRQGMEKRSLFQATLGAILFLPLGLYLFETVTLDLLVRATGVGVLAMVLLSLRDRAGDSQQVSSGGSCFLAGAVSGFLAGAVSIAGPPIAAFALKQGWPQARYKAFVTQCLLVIAIYKAALLIARSHVTVPILWQIAVTAALSIAGVQLGAIASRDIPTARFKRIVAITLIVVSCLMLWRGQSGPAKESSKDEATGPPATTILPTQPGNTAANVDNEAE